MKKLNLGCGINILDGYENFDKYPIDGKVKYLNLNKLPLPFDDDSVDEILLSHVLEHLDCNRFDFVMDCRRILKKDGKLIVKLPPLGSMIGHNSYYHGAGYFDSIICKCQYSEATTPFIDNDFFTLVSFKKSKRGLFYTIQKLVALFCDLIHNEYVWELKKKIKLRDKRT